jgi:AcrR family transcriptional regulator
MRAIADEVGVAAPSVYLHFRNRDDIFRAAVLEDYSALAAAMSEAGKRGPSARESLKAMGEAYCEFAMRHPGRYRLITEVQQKRSARSSSNHEGHPAEAAQRLLIQAIEECGREDGLLKLDRELAFTCIWSGWHGFVELKRAKPLRDWPDLAQVVAEIVDGAMRG